MAASIQRVLVLVLVIFLAVAMPGAPFAARLQTSYLAGYGAVLFAGSAWFWVRSGALLWRRRRSGAILLNLGHLAPDIAGNGAGAALSAAILLWAVLFLGPRYPLAAVGYGSFGAYMLQQSLAPFLVTVQLRERGVFLPSQGVPWERIDSYTMRDVSTRIEVVIRYRTWGTFGGYPWEVAIPCPASRRASVQAILAEYIPTRGRRRSFPPAEP